MRWFFPLPYSKTKFIPEKPHPGSFGMDRRHHVHTGVDLYTEKDQQVHAVEDGIIIDKGQFTGAAMGSPWWNDTWYIYVEGESGIVCYGEIQGCPEIAKVKRGEVIAWVTPVLKNGSKPEIPFHSPSMLHIELYVHGFTVGQEKEWLLGAPQPSYLIDPTEKLKESLS